MKYAQVVIFDVDGVLVDSLPQHLQICRDKSAEFGLDLQIPSETQFRNMVSSGIKISPMRYFFLAVGFPEEYANLATDYYDREFSTRYRPKLFDGVYEMLKQLSQSGFSLGLVTSNLRSNIEPILGPSISYFEPSHRFYFDTHSDERPKSWYLTQCIHSFGVNARACIYVGDQPADVRAAHDASTQFLGVSYGWGLSEGASADETVNSVAAIARSLNYRRATTTIHINRT